MKMQVATDVPLRVAWPKKLKKKKATSHKLQAASLTVSLG